MAEEEIEVTEDNIADLVREGYLNEISVFEYKRDIQEAVNKYQSLITQAVQKFEQIIDYVNDPEYIVKFYRAADDTIFYIKKKRERCGFSH